MAKWFIFFALTLTNCQSGDNDITELKKRYSIEEINYFYETALYNEELGEQPHFIVKWKHDILISIFGDTLVGDHARVQDVIEQLNALSLPIGISMTPDTTVANLRVRFGNKQQLNLANSVRGHANITATKRGIAQYADVEIVNDTPEKIRDNVHRQSIILEEITQSLGIPADSYAYPRSVFYEGWNREIQLSEIDKRIIQLLYEPSIPVGCTCAQFAEDFADVLQSVNGRKGLFQSKLYHQNSQREFLNYVQSQSISRTTVKRILQRGLVKSQRDTILRVVKYIKPVPVTLHGDTIAEQKVIVQKILSLFEETAPFLHLYLSDRKPTDKVGIQIKFEKDPSASSAVTAQTYPWYMEDSLFSQRIGANVEVVYRDTTEALLKLPLALADILYYSVCVIRQDGKPSVYENGSLQLKPEYAELLHTYYAPELANNMTKTQLESVLEQMQ